jgi:peptidyl-prolyl cis-trans isomerase-like 3
MSLTLVTSLGEIKVELEAEKVPGLCENFLKLAASGAYNSTTFHRNIRSFIIQGGDPLGTGKGGDSIHGGKMADEFHADLKHDRRGVVSFANSGPNTIGSQFFITYSRQPTLDGVYSVIGSVIHGMEVLDAMESKPVAGKNRPVTDIVLNYCIIHANPFAPR